MEITENFDATLNKPKWNTLNLWISSEANEILYDRKDEEHRL